MRQVIYWILKYTGIFKAAGIQDEETKGMATEVVFTLAAFITPVIALGFIFM